MFEPINFQNLNETDIREEILAPLIRRLGYRSGTEHNVIREQSLRYPRVFLGRKNSKKDPILRGIADYILEAGLAVRWVIEAKAPDVELDIEAIDQAYTYANHPEVTLDDAQKEQVINELHNRWSDPGCEIVKRMSSFSEKSPKILKPILEG